MLKWNYAIQLGLAGVLAVPALTAEVPATAVRSRAKETVPAIRTSALEQSLAETLRAIEVLSGLQPRVAAGEPGSLEVVRSATEPPLGDAHQRDTALATARSEVNRLQMLSDELATRVPSDAKRGPEPRENSAVPRESSAKSAALEAATTATAAARNETSAITTGLDEPARRALALPAANSAAGTRPLAGAPDPHAGSDSTAAQAAPADPLRRAQACFRAGRYAECLASLQPIEKDVRAKYWKARALEQLGRETEAIAAFEEVAKDKDAGYLATRAASDLEYLRWRAEVARKLESEARRRSEPNRGGAAAVRGAP